ncbi:development-specific protein LVN1.2-like [Amphiura filiformis]|uniref:development-specific protein LVN1.2-like n=1 Tax=Amphiura filiformis TaxID=82378 RepID=UPI003B21D1B1
MLHIRFIVVVVITATAITQAAEPKKCCYPDQFTIFQGSTIASFIEEQKIPVAFYEAQYSAFDYTNNRFGAYGNRTFFTGQDVQSYKVITDMKKKLSWEIDPIKKQCVQKPATDFLNSRCIPENATYVGKNYLGNKGVYFDIWVFNQAINQTDWQVTGTASMSVDTDNGCVPIGGSFSGKVTAGGVTEDVVSTSGNMNFELGIGDPDKYFKLPDYCQQATKEPSKLLGLLQKTKL